MGYIVACWRFLKKWGAEIVSLSIIVVAIVSVIIAIIYLPRRIAAKKELFDAIENNDIQKVSEILDNYPRLSNERYFTVIVPPDAYNTTPLCDAISFADIEMVELLMESGADVNKMEGGYYPLMLALRRCEYEIAWYLIEQGANLSVTNKYNTVPYSIVSHVDVDDIEKAEAQLEFLKYMIEQDVSLKQPSNVYFYSEPGPTRTIDLLGRTAYSNSWLAAEYLIEVELFQVNGFVNENQQTALFLAVKGEAYNSCEVLLANGADKTLKDIYGKTALDYAIEVGNERIIELLQDP